MDMHSSLHAVLTNMWSMRRNKTKPILLYFRLQLALHYPSIGPSTPLPVCSWSASCV